MRVDFNYLSMNKSDRPGRRFENYIATLLDVLGCSVTFTGAEGTSEEGADFVAIRSTELFPGRFDVIRWGVQCKCVEKPENYKNKIESQLWDLVRLLSNKKFIVGTELAETPSFLLCFRGLEILVFDGLLLGR